MVPYSDRGEGDSDDEREVTDKLKHLLENNEEYEHHLELRKKSMYDLLDRYTLAFIEQDPVQNAKVRQVNIGKHYYEMWTTSI